MTDCLELMLTNHGTQPDGFTPVCVEYPPYGVHYIDKMLGAHVYHHAGQWNADYLKTPVGELEMPDLDKDETWQLSKRAAQAFPTTISTPCNCRRFFRANEYAKRRLSRAFAARTCRQVHPRQQCKPPRNGKARLPAQ